MVDRAARGASGLRPLRIGITGPIGCGKSTVAGWLAEAGAIVVDADRLAREVTGPGAPALEAVFARFGDAVHGEDGTLDRAALGQIVFADQAALRDLEAIVHPAVRAARAAFLRANAAAPLVVFDIPLLFEKAGADEVDAVLVVSASPEVQRARVLARPGMTAERFAQILALQLPDAEKRKRADYLIDTGAGLAETEAAVAALVDKLSG